jgi:hypothetical protein
MVTVNVKILVTVLQILQHNCANYQCLALRNAHDFKIILTFVNETEKY